MALCYFRVSHRGRTTHTVPTTRHAQYITRQGPYAPAADHANYLTRSERHALGKEDLVASGGNYPDWAQGDAGTFWQAADQYERLNGRLCETWIISLPRELSQSQNTELAQRFVQEALGERYPHTWAMHEVTARDGRPQPHIHVMFSHRAMDGIDREPEQFFRRYNAAHPDQGGAQKDPWMVDRGHIAWARQLYSDITNAQLERHGHTARIDPRSLEERGIRGRVTELHLGPRHSTEAATEMQERRVARAPFRAEEQQRAQDYWTARKAALGITADMSQHEIIQRIGAASRQQINARQQTPTQDRSPESTAQRITQTQQQLNDAQVEQMAARHRERTQAPTSAATMARINRLVQEEEPTRHVRVTPNLEPSRQYRERGMGW